MDKNITIGTVCGGAAKRETEKESERERGGVKRERKAGDGGEFIASARLHARKFDKDVV